jgi:hypothetical protein
LNGLKICGQEDKHRKIMTWWLAYPDGSRVTEDSADRDEGGNSTGPAGGRLFEPRLRRPPRLRGGCGGLRGFSGPFHVCAPRNVLSARFSHVGLGSPRTPPQPPYARSARGARASQSVRPPPRTGSRCVRTTATRPPRRRSGERTDAALSGAVGPVSTGPVLERSRRDARLNGRGASAPARR